MTGLGTGELARLLEALLPLPALPAARSIPPAPPPADPEDQVVLHYAAVPSPPASRENLLPDLSNVSPVPQVPVPDPAVAAVVAAHLVQQSWHIDSLQAPVVHSASHAVASTAGPKASQSAIDVPAYIAPFRHLPDRISPIDAASGRARPRRFAALLRGIGNLCTRAPLLVLLLAWLIAGLCGAMSNVWALGFLAIVGFGFYARVRRVRF